ncbi:MAG: glutamate racemase [Phycisphaerales bacterium]|jgi:glutamate racemase|nr:glutamate racemase [Phycisphaerales bacterium]
MNGDQRPVCVFDSGLGGLTVVRELMGAMPSENIVYLGDSARVPYGTKSLETVRRFALEDASFLVRHNPKLLVVACNTASAAAIDILRDNLDTPVVDVIRPGAKAAVDFTDGPVGVIATEATIASGAYVQAIAQYAPEREVCTASCPLLVPIVEEGRSDDDPIVLHVLGDYLGELQRFRPAALILGCTHYPLLAGAISKLMGPETELISSAKAAADQARAMLADLPVQADGAAGTLKCFTTGNPQRFAQLGQRFLGGKIDNVAFVGTDELEIR